MRAKFKISKVSELEGGNQELMMHAVGAKSYGPEGESEDNTFSRYTPAGTLTIWVNNPELAGKFAPGQSYYLDFTLAD